MESAAELLNPNPEACNHTYLVLDDDKVSANHWAHMLFRFGARCVYIGRNVEQALGALASGSIDVAFIDECLWAEIQEALGSYWANQESILASRVRASELIKISDEVEATIKEAGGVVHNHVIEQRSAK